MRIPPTRALCCLVLVSAGACAPVATYPPEEGVVDMSAPANEPVPTLMAVSISYARSEYGGGDDFAINLPPQTPTAMYDKVIRRVGAGHPMTDPDEPTYHVTKVMARGLNGSVDMFCPAGDGDYEFVTFTFRRDPFGKYTHERTRVWKTGEQPPPPAYTGPVLASDTPPPGPYDN